MVEPARLAWLLLLLPLVVLHWYRRRRARQRSVPLNVSYRSAELSWTWRRGSRWIVPASRYVAWAALILGLISPFDWRSSQLGDVEGIAIELVVDRSGSMLADDYQLDGKRVSRLAAVRDAATRFILGDRSGKQRRSDSVGLITFARAAQVECPLTLDHEQLVARLESTRAAADYRQDGTAIGDGLALAVAELQSLQKSLQRSTKKPLTRVVVLLTDGQQNAGELTPERAAALAKHYGIRVYTIGLTPSRAEAEAAKDRLLKERERLRGLSELTGGEFFTVSDARSLRRVYASIDSLERSPLPARRFAAKQYWAIESFKLGPFVVPPLALIAGFALAVELVLSFTIYAEIP